MLQPSEIARLDPQIGILNTGVFYAFVDGYDKPETRGTLQEVEIALGIRPQTAAAQAPKRHFLVTVTPKFVVYAGTWALGEYTTKVYAKDRAEAIKKARNERWETEGAKAVPVTYKARLAKDGE